MAPVAFFSLLIPLLVMLAIVWAVWQLVAQQRGRVSEPCCGACQYPVRGLTALACPECGADLRQVGIQTPRMRLLRPPGMASAATAWTAAVLVMGVLLTGVIGSIPPIVEQRVHTRLNYASRAGSFAEPIRMDLYSRSKTWDDAAQRVVYTIGADAGAVKLAAQRDRRDLWRITETADESRLGAELDTPALLSLLAAGGRDLADPAAAEEAAELLAALHVGGQSIKRAQGFVPVTLRNAGGSTSIQQQPPGWFLFVALVVALLIWITGLRLILRRQARLRRQFAERMMAPAGPHGSLAGPAAADSGTAPVPAAVP